MEHEPDMAIPNSGKLIVDILKRFLAIKGDIRRWLVCTESRGLCISATAGPEGPDSQNSPPGERREKFRANACTDDLAHLRGLGTVFETRDYRVHDERTSVAVK